MIMSGGAQMRTADERLLTMSVTFVVYRSFSPKMFVGLTEHGLRADPHSFSGAPRSYRRRYRPSILL